MRREEERSVNLEPTETKGDMMPKNDITKKQLVFAIFCIENIADYLSLRGDEIYNLLTEKSDILDNYIIPYMY